MVLILEVPLAAVALIVSLTSWKTLQAIKHLDIGKSFWIPIFVSGVFFVIGSIAAILNDLGISFTVYTAEIAAMIKLVALCALASGVYTYSRKIREHLVQKITIPTGTAEVAADGEKVEDARPVPKRLHKEVLTEVKCKYEFGYLNTLPRTAAIPDECLNCLRIIDCKHSHPTKTDHKPAKPSLDVIPDVVVSDTELEEAIDKQ